MNILTSAVPEGNNSIPAPSPTISDGSAPPISPNLHSVLNVFQQWMYLPDTSTLEVTLATYVANRLSGDPVWLLLVGRSSGGKTEVLNAFLNLPKMVCASTISEASLLSGTERKKMAKDATGGLLRKIGDFGILALKDFTSVFAMNRDTKMLTLAALREIHDGKWVRPLGAEGGRDLSWKGKMGLLAGSTEAVDSEHVTMAELGPRFLYFRLPKAYDPAAEEQAICDAVMASSQREIEMRSALEGAVRVFIESIDYTQIAELSEEETAAMKSLAQFSVRCRSHVARDGYRRDVIQINESEGPARFLRGLAQLGKGLIVIGVTPARRLELVKKIALDCMPPIRRLIVDAVIADPGGIKQDFPALVDTGYSTMTLKRAAEDLKVHGLIELITGAETRWYLAERWRSDPNLCEVLQYDQPAVRMSRVYTHADATTGTDTAYTA